MHYGSGSAGSQCDSSPNSPPPVPLDVLAGACRAGVGVGGGGGVAGRVCVGVATAGATAAAVVVLGAGRRGAATVAGARRLTCATTCLRCTRERRFGARRGRVGLRAAGSLAVVDAGAAGAGAAAVATVAARVMRS